jgi:putative transposase
MRQSRLADEQMVRVVREGVRDPVAEVAKRQRNQHHTIYIWRKRFGALGSQDVRRLCELELENARLNKLAAERDLEIDLRTAA